MLVIAIIMVIIWLVLLIKLKIKRLAIAIVIGCVISILSFIAFILLNFSAQRDILWVLLGVLYVSTIAFLILWNLKETKMVYWILAVPAVCIAAAAAIIGYHNYTQKIQTVEENFYFYRYVPFSTNRFEESLLVKLEQESSLKIIDNLLVLDGATALYPVYASFVQAVYPKDEEYYISEGPVMCNGTNKAYENLLEGKADIIFCAGPSAAQKERFIGNGLELKMVSIGREAFVFFVNKNNIVNNITIKDIHGIYSGKIKNWRELNGPYYQRIRAFQRPKDSGSQTMLEKVMGGIPLMKPRRENVPEGMGDIINQVAVYRNFPNAIGYSFLFYSTTMVNNDQIKLLSVEGVYPSRETIQDNSYPFSDDFYAIYIDNDEKNENTELFIEWILSRQGQELIQKTGYVPIR
jgi:phosphate transport system substrate-binding protein